MADDDASGLMTVAQAIEVLDQTPVRPRIEQVALAASAGRRLAEDRVADRDYPPFRKSLMDGYAVRASEVRDAPAALRVVGEIFAGMSPARALSVGEAMAIMTGAPMPAGADGVVPFEEVEQRLGLGKTIRTVRPVDAARYVVARGSDCPARQTVLHRGQIMGPAQIAVAATIGATTLAVYVRPRVAILGTGDELAGADDIPGPAAIRDSNTPMLAALLTQLGCEVIDIQRVGDDPELIAAAIARATASDALFITGGMSMGTHDHVPRLLREAAMDLRISKLRIKPGKPFAFAVRSSDVQESPHHGLVLGLPGNPVAAFILTVRLAARVLTRIAGGKPEDRWRRAQLATDLLANGGREFYQPALLTCADADSPSGLPDLMPIQWKGSADSFSLAAANALLVRPANDPARQAGETVAALEM